MVKTVTDTYGSQDRFKPGMAAIAMQTLDAIKSSDKSALSFEDFLTFIKTIAKQRADLQETMNLDTSAPGEAPKQRQWASLSPSWQFSKPRFSDTESYFRYFRIFKKMVAGTYSREGMFSDVRYYDDWNNDPQDGAGIAYLKALTTSAETSLATLGKIRSDIAVDDYNEAEQSELGNWLAKRYVDDRVLRAHMEALSHVCYQFESNASSAPRHRNRQTITCGNASNNNAALYYLTHHTPDHTRTEENSNQTLSAHMVHETTLDYPSRIRPTIRKRIFGCIPFDRVVSTKTMCVFLVDAASTVQRHIPMTDHLKSVMPAGHGIRILDSQTPGDPKELGLMLFVARFGDDYPAPSDLANSFTLRHINPWEVRGVLLHAHEHWHTLMAAAPGTLSPEQLQHHLSAFTFLFGHAMPFERGSASACEIITLALAAHHGYFLDIATNRPYITPDWLNFLVEDMAQQQACYPSMFPLNELSIFTEETFLPCFQPAGSAVTSSEIAATFLANHGYPHVGAARAGAGAPPLRAAEPPPPPVPASFAGTAAGVESPTAPLVPKMP